MAPVSYAETDRYSRDGSWPFCSLSFECTTCCSLEPGSSASRIWSFRSAFKQVDIQGWDRPFVCSFSFGKGLLAPSPIGYCFTRGFCLKEGAEGGNKTGTSAVAVGLSTEEPTTTWMSILRDQLHWVHHAQQATCSGSQPHATLTRARNAVGSQTLS